MIKPSNLQEELAVLTVRHGRGFQARVAERLKISPSLLSKRLSGERRAPEGFEAAVREAIAAELP